MRLGQRRCSAGRGQHAGGPRARRASRCRGGTRARDPAGTGARDHAGDARPARDRLCRIAATQPATERAPRRRPHPGGLRGPTRRADAGDPRAPDERRGRAPARSVTAASLAAPRDHGRGLRRAGEHDADDRVEHPLRPGGGADRLSGLGRGDRGGRHRSATPGARPRRDRTGADRSGARRPARAPRGQRTRRLPRPRRRRPIR